MPSEGSAGPRERVTRAGSENIKIALNPLKGLDVLGCVCMDFYSPGAGRHCPGVSYRYREVLLGAEHVISWLLGVSQLMMFRIFPPN